MPEDYLLKFDLSSYHALDNFALLAHQRYSLGNEGDWFGQFRGGLYGLHARIFGVQIHYRKVHSWNFNIRSPLETEYHVSSILFNMDSAIECIVFALNALGYIADSTKFLDVTSEKALSKITPYNILGRPPTHTSGFVQGYDDYFPSLKSFWVSNLDLIHIIFEQHDVSKHRSTICQGGRARNDPPPGFFERLGIGDDKVKQSFFAPMEEIILSPEPKTPWQQRKSRDYESTHKLEDLAAKFCTFVSLSGTKALEDAKTNIKLNYYKFIKE